MLRMPQPADGTALGDTNCFCAGSLPTSGTDTIIRATGWEQHFGEVFGLQMLADLPWLW